MVLRRPRRTGSGHVTGIRTEQLYPASQLLSSLIAFGPQPNKAIVGRNAFAHEAGIHQDGFLKERTTYEIMEPASVGVPESRLVLGKHSGRHALRKRCEDLGFGLTAAQIDAVYHRFTALADRKKGVTDDEIAHLARIETGEARKPRRSKHGRSRRRRRLDRPAGAAVTASRRYAVGCRQYSRWLPTPPVSCLLNQHGPSHPRAPR